MYISTSIYDGILRVHRYYDEGMSRRIETIEITFEKDYDAIIKLFWKKRMECKHPKIDIRYGRATYEEIREAIRNKHQRAPVLKKEKSFLELNTTIKYLIAEFNNKLKRKGVPVKQIFHDNSSHLGYGFKI